MSDSVYTFLVAPALGCVTAFSLVVVGYLASLEVADRRRKRRMMEKLEQLDLSRRYRRTSRYLASQKPTIVMLSSPPRLNLGQHIQKGDRLTGWNSAPNDLN